MAGRRRSAGEWADLIREMEASGKSLPAFARAHRIRPDTLKWWRWRLRSEAKTGKSKPAPKRSARVKLVAVEPVHELSREAQQVGVPVWELEAPSGHRLRVYDRAGLRVLKAALSAVSGSRRR
jgi:hypothetical protein